MVKLFNLYYFIAIFITIIITMGLYFLLKNKRKRTKEIVLLSLLIFNLILHFLKIVIPPYSENPSKLARDIWFINICAISVLTYPFIFISKSNSAKDFMFYLGVISGGLALLYPTEAINNYYVWDVLRFYYCHITIFMVPLLMVLLNLHSLNYHRIWKVPFYMCAVFLIIICNQVLQSELGFTSMRGDDIYNLPWTNTSLIWGPTDDIAKAFTWLTPNFMKTIPYGTYAGTEKYWPFFYILPATFFYFLLLPAIICLPWELKHIKNDFSILKSKLKTKK